MCPRIQREILSDGSFIDRSLDTIEPDNWRPHGVRYRLAWIQSGVCRVLFDNHHGKGDHMHVDGEESDYRFVNVTRLLHDFDEQIRKLGAPV